MRLPTLAKAAAGAFVLVVVAVLVTGYLGQYRSARDGSRGGRAEPSREATRSRSGTVTGAGRNVMSRAEPSDASWVVVQIEGLNLRTRPAADADVIRGLERNERLRFVAGRTGWYQVTDKEGRTGWISSNPQYATLEK